MIHTDGSSFDTEGDEPRDIQDKCDDLASRILKYCVRHHVKISAAESLTGGLLADAFVRVPGASRVFLGSVVTYDIAAKASILDVDRVLLAHEGAVHPDVARQMAMATAELYGQNEYGDAVIGLSTTGVAGPGPDGDKPAGLVYIGLSLPPVLATSHLRFTRVVELHCFGSREEIRRQSVYRILENLSQFTVNLQE